MTFRRLGAVGVVLVMTLAAPGAAAAGTGPAPRPQAYRDQPPLAYVSEGRVLVLDGKGNPPVRVRGVADACCVAFSPDGYYVAFERRGDLWVAEHDGSELHRVARSAAASPSRRSRRAIRAAPASAARLSCSCSRSPVRTARTAPRCAQRPRSRSPSIIPRQRRARCWRAGR